MKGCFKAKNSFVAEKYYDKVNLSVVMVLNAVNGNQAYKRSVYQAKQMLEKVFFYKTRAKKSMKLRKKRTKTQQKHQIDNHAYSVLLWFIYTYATQPVTI